MRRQRRISLLSRQRRARNMSDGFPQCGIIHAFFHHRGNPQSWNFHGSQHAIIAQRACRAIRGNQRSVRVRGRLRFSSAPHRVQHRFFPMLMNGRPGVRHRTIPNCDDRQHPQTNFERFQQRLVAIRHRCLENSPRELRHLGRLSQPASRPCAYFFQIHAHPENVLGVSICRVTYQADADPGASRELRQARYDLAIALRNITIPTSAKIPISRISGIALAVAGNGCSLVIATVCTPATGAFELVASEAIVLVTGADQDAAASGSALGYASSVPVVGIRVWFASPIWSATVRGYANCSTVESPVKTIPSIAGMLPEPFAGYVTKFCPFDASFGFGYASTVVISAEPSLL